jgi:hypothetical protein
LEGAKQSSVLGALFSVSAQSVAQWFETLKSKNASSFETVLPTTSATTTTKTECQSLTDIFLSFLSFFFFFSSFNHTLCFP